MKVKELREFDVPTLAQKFIDEKEAYFNLRFQYSAGKLENSAALKKKRKNIARILTIINEKKLTNNQEQTK